MKRWKLKSAPIRTQVLLLSLLPILILSISTTLTKPLIPDTREKEAYASELAGKIHTLADMAASARDAAELDTVLRLAPAAGFPVESLTPIEAKAVREMSETTDHLGALVAQALAQDRTRVEIRTVPVAGEGMRQIALATLDPQRSIAITLPTPPDFPLARDLVFNLSVKVALLVLPMLLFAFYASRTIATPLMRFSRAAGTMSGAVERSKRFRIEGCQEVQALATSLNAMRDRIFDMLDDRKAMMRAVSHDLRTPLTRLRLRAERCEQPALREALLGDIANLSAMVENCLLYITNPQESEKPIKTDLASMMKTVCDDFSDIGVDAVYRGPQRFAFTCKPQSLLRAVTNLVANASRFASAIEVHLEPQTDGTVSLAVLDNGPGIPEAQRERMIQPFVKGDKSRATTAGGGFGLGLSIVSEIAKANGGILALSTNEPHGLKASITLKTPK